MTSDHRLYARGARTLLASWEAYARGAHGAALHRLPGVAAAVFPMSPERDVYNNALLDGGVGAMARERAIDEMEAVYAAAGVARFAAWAHDRDTDLHAALEARGYAADDATRVMGMALDDLRFPRPRVQLGSPTWDMYLRLTGLPEGLLSGAEHAALHPVIATVEGRPAAAALAFDHDGDCGIYNVETAAWARRRGLATAVTAVQLHEAMARGAQTASLQSTPEAEGVYVALGFRDLGRYIEYRRA
jgi:ribosomal protein S18 acetylase RimI-like enzyme